jgi:predicted transcriptional regulator of viral defense system
LIQTMPTAPPTVKTLFKQQGWTLRSSEMLRAGLHQRTIAAMVKSGTIERLARGLYRWSDAPAASDPDLVIIARKIPKGVVCLVSALAIHGLTTQIPHAVHLALPRTARAPVLAHPPVEIHLVAPAIHAAGVTTIDISGTTVRVYTPEKTLADCFRFRNQIGMDVVLEALRAYRSRRSANLQQVLDFARICRVEAGMRPYLEATT